MQTREVSTADILASLVKVVIIYELHLSELID